MQSDVVVAGVGAGEGRPRLVGPKITSEGDMIEYREASVPSSDWKPEESVS